MLLCSVSSKYSCMQVKIVNLVSPAAKRQTLRNDELCARPDCLYPHLEVQEFVIERLIGRKSVGQAGDLYLVKWDGCVLFLRTLRVWSLNCFLVL